MSTPICDFVNKYIASSPVRMHMPGHKGKAMLGFEPYDLTEIDGADDLMAPDGIIAQSEAEASRLFGARTFYSCGGSTLCIQVMLHLISLYAAQCGKKPVVLAGRNAHKAFVNACALLDIGIEWIYPDDEQSYIACNITAQQISERLAGQNGRITAVYITSPDYLGNMQDIAAIARACHESGALLSVDNAHGAYLKFMPTPAHPMDLGADICCDSAHKTLGVITGGAYLHISVSAPAVLAERAKASFSVFGTSSPSYLILQSLDAANGATEAFRNKLRTFLPEADSLKAKLAAHGFELAGSEALKLTLKPKSFGYIGQDIAATLEAANIYPEFYDPDYIVLMLSPRHSERELDALCDTLCSLPRRAPIVSAPPRMPRPERAISPREALLAAAEKVPLPRCLGRISAASAIGCPPAIPIVIMGERINSAAIACLEYYGIESCMVVK